MGIICACLPGVKPALAELFPATFGSTRRDTKASHACAAHHGQRSRHWAAGTPQAFAFEQLSSSSQRNITRDGHIPSSSIEDVSELYGQAAAVGGKRQGCGTSTSGMNNNAWVSVSEHRGPDQHRVPDNSISVSTEVMVNNEVRGDVGLGRLNHQPSCRESQELIFEGGDLPGVL